jgi:sporulation protein YlmC with PRC-barrel domain
MLVLSENLINKHVLSLRTGGSVASVVSPIINPDNLKIEGFYCQDRFSKDHLVLLTKDIRDTAPNGYFVNDHEVLSQPEELIRLKRVLEINFNPLGKQVITTSKNKVGKVTDYAYDTNSMYILKIYVSQSILKSLSGGTLSIDRSSIQEITPRYIIINELTRKAGLRVSTVPNPL